MQIQVPKELKGAGLSADLEIREDEMTSDLRVTWFSDQRRLGDEEHHGAHLRWPCGRRKGETAEAKDTKCHE